jgi:hypothetical protein
MNFIREMNKHEIIVELKLSIASFTSDNSFSCAFWKKNKKVYIASHDYETPSGYIVQYIVEFNVFGSKCHHVRDMFGQLHGDRKEKIVYIRDTTTALRNCLTEINKIPDGEVF